MKKIMLEGIGGRRMNSETITVNGKVYDAVTGLPVEARTASQAERLSGAGRVKPSHHVHRQTEASRAVSRREASAPATPQIQKRSDTRRVVQPAATKNPAITRFAPQPSRATNQPRLVNDIAPASPHPLVQRAEMRMREAQAHHMTATIKPSAVIKQEAIEEALDKAPRHNTIKPKRSSFRPRMLSFASMALSLLLLAGYLTYINLPNLSVRVAANQAGISAGYPGYRPDGYRLAGVNYDRGSVSLKFAANAGPQNFTLTQQQTSWDSTAVKENYVKTNWGDDVVPYSERGLTIYAHEGNAAWVNGGILYTITGDAPLSSSQVRSIATSL